MSKRDQHDKEEVDEVEVDVTAVNKSVTRKRRKQQEKTA